MKTEINNYARLLVSQLREGTEVHSAVSKLKKILKRRRHESVLLPTLEKAKRILVESRDYSALTLVVSTEKDAKKYHGEVGGRQEPLVIVDQEMIGGYVVMKDYVMRDQSYRTKLIDWYRRSTKY